MGCGSSKSTEVGDAKHKKDVPKPANSNPAGEGNGIAKNEVVQPKNEEVQPKLEEKVVEKKPEEKKIEEVQEEEGEPPTLDMRKAKNSPKKDKVKD